MKNIGRSAVIFDLDGIIVDTARFHIRAWLELAAEEKVVPPPDAAERTRGVSRMESLDIILENSPGSYTRDERCKLAERKNQRYVELLDSLTRSDILPGIPELIGSLKAAGLFLAVFSSSKNTDQILDQLGIRNWFDVIVSGHDITVSKPDPEGFLLTARRLGVLPESCVMIEDAEAGVEGAVAAGMKCIGVGDAFVLKQAHHVFSSTDKINLTDILFLLCD